MAQTRIESETIDLYIKGVDRKTLGAISKIAERERPKTTRNELIVFWLEEIAAGRMKVVEVATVAA